jgi:hypothetical protein
LYNKPDEYAKLYPMPRSITGGNKYRSLALQVGGSLKNRDIKICSRVPWDSDLRKAALVMPDKTEH